MFYITSISEFCASNAIDDAKRNAGLTTPEDIERFDDISYGADERNVLDVYRPKNSRPMFSTLTSSSPLQEAATTMSAAFSEV